ncbi:MAG: ester cyclase [Myxococcota bacterium]|nr:ester cyclase [Myxococcota bacterium]
MQRILPTLALSAIFLVGGVSMAGRKDRKADAQAAEAARIAATLQTFDELDYEVFTHQQWERLSESHAEDILVHWPDGHTTKGLEQHQQDLAAMFVWAPDTRIEEHPVRLGQGEWTAVIGIIEGTFTEPMPIGGGQFIQPTGQAYSLQMATIGHWNEDGVMDEEYLFWDNQEFMRQIGLGG